MKCKRCSYIMDFRQDAFPVEVPITEGDYTEWVELWICPECGEEEVA